MYEIFKHFFPCTLSTGLSVCVLELISLTPCLQVAPHSSVLKSAQRLVLRSKKQKHVPPHLFFLQSTDYKAVSCVLQAPALIISLTVSFLYIPAKKLHFLSDYCILAITVNRKYAHRTFNRFYKTQSPSISATCLSLIVVFIVG